jgi:hypothetical protein
VVYTVNGTLPDYAPLYSSMTKVNNQPVVMFGRGLDRGASVSVNGQLKGWQWGGGDSSLSWGTDMISGDYGSIYGWQFTNSSNPNEGQVASGDSGGGVFIDDGGIWKLAGIINSVQESFSLDGTNTTAMDAAIFDTTGLYQASGSNWSKIAASTTPIGTWGYATSIASHSTFIQSAVNASTVPEPASLGITGLGGMLLVMRSSRRSKCCQ